MERPQVCRPSGLEMLGFRGVSPSGQTVCGGETDKATGCPLTLYRVAMQNPRLNSAP